MNTMTSPVPFDDGLKDLTPYVAHIVKDVRVPANESDAERHVRQLEEAERFDSIVMGGLFKAGCIVAVCALIGGVLAKVFS